MSSILVNTRICMFSSVAESMCVSKIQPLVNELEEW